MDIKIGQIVSYKDQSRKSEVTGKIVCISQVQDCCFKECIGKLMLDVEDDEYGNLLKIWADDLIEYKVPEECYEEYGNDLDGCSRQENGGCKGCICLVKVGD